MEKYTIYTDGGCIHNPGGCGACAAVIISHSTGEIVELSKAFEHTTNNRMEIYAAIMALEAIDEEAEVALCSDSQYLIRTMEGDYTKKTNKDLWEHLSRASEKKNIHTQWVRGHNNNYYNEKCDAMCSEAMCGVDYAIDSGYNGKKNTDKENVQLKTGSMGEVIILPARYKDEINLRKKTVADELASEKNINIQCAKKIISICKKYSNLRFKDFKNLKVGGRDSWSSKNKDVLKKEIVNYEEAFKLIHEHISNELYQKSCMRWYGRGLPLELCIRKVLVDMEIMKNCM